VRKMSMLHRWLACVLLGFIALVSTACAPEVGSPAWCERMDATPKGDWSTNQAADYARNCLFQSE